MFKANGRGKVLICARSSAGVNEAPPGRQAARESASAARCCKGVRFRLELLLWSFGMFGFSRSRLSDSAARLGSVAMGRCAMPWARTSDAVRSIFHIHVATIANRSSSPSGRTVGGRSMKCANEAAASQPIRRSSKVRKFRKQVLLSCRRLLIKHAALQEVS